MEKKIATAQTNGPLEITRQDVENYVKMKLYTEMTLIKEKLSLFEKKYKCDFIKFEQALSAARKEDFEQWDDYMEWKAFYKKYNRLKEKTIQV